MAAGWAHISGCDLRPASVHSSCSTTIGLTEFSRGQSSHHCGYHSYHPAKSCGKATSILSRPVPSHIAQEQGRREAPQISEQASEPEPAEEAVGSFITAPLVREMPDGPKRCLKAGKATCSYHKVLFLSWAFRDSRPPFSCQPSSHRHGAEASPISPHLQPVCDPLPTLHPDPKPWAPAPVSPTLSRSHPSPPSLPFSCPVGSVEVNDRDGL